MDEKEVFERGLDAVYDSKAIMRIVFLEDARIIELIPIETEDLEGFEDFGEEE